MDIFSYRTIQRPSEGQYKEKGSKFLGFAFPVQSEEEIKLRIAELKKRFFDARHHCFAFILGADKARFRAFDDGEPNHSAGDPILGQIRSKNLTNVLVVVVRYFGGVKLGVSGLISAYKQAAADALVQATIVEEELQQQYTLQYSYENTPEVMKLIRDFNLQVLKQTFDSACSMEISIALKQKLNFEERIRLLNALGTSVSIRENLLS